MIPILHHPTPLPFVSPAVQNTTVRHRLIRIHSNGLQHWKRFITWAKKKKEKRKNQDGIEWDREKGRSITFQEELGLREGKYNTNSSAKERRYGGKQTSEDPISSYTFFAIFHSVIFFPDHFITLFFDGGHQVFNIGLNNRMGFPPLPFHHRFLISTQKLDSNRANKRKSGYYNPNPTKYECNC